MTTSLFNFKRNFLFLALVCLVSIGFAQKSKEKEKAKPTLDGKKFKVLYYEMKAAGRGKSQEGEIAFAMGKMNSEFMNEKLKIEESHYTVILDSSYNEDDTPMHLFKVESL